MLDILLDNARKYTEPSGTVSVYLERWGHYRCRLTVSNPGTPSPRLNRRIFSSASIGPIQPGAGTEALVWALPSPSASQRNTTGASGRRVRWI
ncbi:MAG: hypothetical protein ACLRWQ_03015 [Flavonifractor plautii]